MNTRTYLFLMLFLFCTAAVFVGCEMLTPDPITGVTPLGEAGGVAIERLAENPSVVGLLEAAVGGAAVIAGAYFGRKKIAAGAKAVGRVAGIVKKKTED